MSNDPVPTRNGSQSAILAQARIRSQSAAIAPYRLTSHEPEPAQQQAEFFYLQKQIQAQTPMVLILEDGEKIEGCIEWYDRSALKIRGRQKTLVYKSAIKYMYKTGDTGQ
jgi:sRNA-binding regulator protein Hfq